MYSFGAMLSFTIAHLAVIQLRRVQPGQRAWKPPLEIPWRKAALPLTALLGGLGTFSAWIVVMALNTRTLLIGLGWMLCGICLYALYRRHQGLRLTQTVKVAGLAPLGVEEVEYKSILVAFDEDDPFSPEAVATAKALAARHPRRAIHVLSLVTVPSNLPLDAELDDREGPAQTKIEQAKLICGRRVSGHIEHVRAGQSGQAIVEEAKAINAAAIVMPLRYRNGSPLYGKTLQTVLAKRPARVIVAAQPGEASDSSPLAGMATGVTTS
jgi:APA family basic amino acid/polyamine antiporter